MIRMTQTGWEKLTEFLAEKILVMADGDTVILSAGNRFVQMQQTKNALLVETASNRWLPNEDQLTIDQQRQLLEAGWAEPTRESAHNYRRILDFPPTIDQVRNTATVMVATLRDVLRVASPHDIERKSFNSLAS